MRTQQMNFKTKNTIILKTTDIEQVLESMQQKILTEMDEFTTKGRTLIRLDFE